MTNTEFIFFKFKCEFLNNNNSINNSINDSINDSINNSINDSINDFHLNQLMFNLFIFLSLYQEMSQRRSTSMEVILLNVI